MTDTHEISKSRLLQSDKIRERAIQIYDGFSLKATADAIRERGSIQAGARRDDMLLAGLLRTPHGASTSDALLALHCLRFGVRLGFGANSLREIMSVIHWKTSKDRPTEYAVERVMKFQEAVMDWRSLEMGDEDGPIDRQFAVLNHLGIMDVSGIDFLCLMIGGDRVFQENMLRYNATGTTNSLSREA